MGVVVVAVRREWEKGLAPEWVLMPPAHANDCEAAARGSGNFFLILLILINGEY